MSFESVRMLSPIDVGVMISSERRDAGLSTKELATMSGISRDYLSRVERGDSACSLETIEKIFRAMNIKPYVAIRQG